MPTPGELPTDKPEAGGGNAAASPQPQPAPEKAPDSPAQDQPPPTIIDDPLMAAFASDLQEMLKAEKTTTGIPKIEAVKEDAAPSQPAATSSAQTPVAPEARPPLKGAVKPRQDPEKVAERVFDRKIAEMPSLPPKKEDKPPEPTEVFTDEQNDELLDAAYAEKAEPERFKGFQDKLKTFYRRVSEWVKEHEKEEERTFDENDEDFVGFVNKVRPAWPGKRENIRIERIADDRAEQKFKERQQQTDLKIGEAQREAREARFTPVIETTVGKVASQYDTETVTDDPLEKEVFSEFRNASCELCTDYLRMLHGIDSPGAHNPKPVQERHNWVVNFIIQKAEEMKEKPAESVRDGKQFVTPNEMFKLRNARDPRVNSVWTFTPEDVLGEIRKEAVRLAKSKIKEEDERMNKRGYVKARPSAGSKQAENPKPMSPPRANTTAAPGPSDNSESVDVMHPGKEIVEALGF